MKKYESIPKWNHEQVEEALRNNDPDALRYAVISISMYDSDWHYAQALCVRLSEHPHYNVRGNAILGFGHISRVHGQLDRALVQPIIEAALSDPHEYVRMHASDAMDDVSHFLGWHLKSSPK